MAEFKRGETIFSENDPAVRVGVIRVGDVHIQRDFDGKAIHVGNATVGDFLGEMAVLEGRTHSATAVAWSDVEIDWIDQEYFLGRVADDGPLAHRLLVRLSQRLHVLNTAYARLAGGLVPGSADSAPPPPAPDTGIAPGVVLKPASDALAQSLGFEEREISTFPFVVGRYASMGEAGPRHRVDLMIDDAEPFRLSREHFAIVQDEDGYAVQDLRSHLGTVVNGVGIGTYCATDIARLNPGENTITAGGDGSHYEFLLAIGPGEN